MAPISRLLPSSYALYASNETFSSTARLVMRVYVRSINFIGLSVRGSFAGPFTVPFPTRNLLIVYNRTSILCV